VKDLFSNFLAKSPDSLFRRIDPDYYYPTFGDDGVVQKWRQPWAKFYVKASNGEITGCGAISRFGYLDTSWPRSTGLYGANAHYAAEPTTSFGERRLTVDGFAAQPGTMASYEEFRGTGGSLYFLHHQDILTGSERVAHRNPRQGL